MSPFDDIPSLTLRELLAAVRAGNEDAETELFNRYDPGFLRFAAHRLLIQGCRVPDQHVEDIDIEAWFRIWKNLGRLRNDETFEPWAKEIIRNLVADHVSGHAGCIEEHLHRVPFDGLDDESARPEKSVYPEEFIYSDITPADEVILSAERLEMILKTAEDERFHEKLFDILTLRIGGLGFDEIGRLLNETHDNVRNIFYRGVRELRILLGDDEGSKGGAEAPGEPPSARGRGDEGGFEDGGDGGDAPDGIVM